MDVSRLSRIAARVAGSFMPPLTPQEDRDVDELLDGPDLDVDYEYCQTDRD